ncbi:hypothetical protein PTSG_03517 [Salpingoeca rosetta]|uniref:Polygalacturonase n=1 Tax=Salpingoeca rosetta (strain ATCC 50818 / BSB-021) TaxID=946362 RepID=F2U5U5_SALR5|nr:uncharacterized protein PTSG_03517 [Salpingoeca rosetta]EGD82886.1 hypothetical protein PTSG_03517 [Salpingoeca rosetta]|eukprot:XP_004995250.1 hypothetical protein PTSG_03517 [Salpingoeca rosetta]
MKRSAPMTPITSRGMAMVTAVVSLVAVAVIAGSVTAAAVPVNGKHAGATVMHMHHSIEAAAHVVDFAKVGGVANDKSLSVAQANSKLMNTTLASLAPGDTLLIPNTTFWLMGGIYATGIRDVVIQIDGTLAYLDDMKAWPRHPDGRVFECMHLENVDNITITSSGMGTIDGHGSAWWGAVEYLLIGENRPKMLYIHNASQLLFEHILFKNSPYYHVMAEDVEDVVIRYCDVDARRTDRPYHDLFDLTAFNTDGFDVAGKNVHIHDCNIWNDDDCIAVKQQTGDSIRSPCSENMLFERINASGVGLTIGSIGASLAHTCVRNITFRDSVMHNTFKGIYMKSRPEDDPATGSISDVLYENITIYNPTQWAIWIGPQQAGYKHACSLLWPEDPIAKCPVPSNMHWHNIVLRDIVVYDPLWSPGVILGNSTKPMEAIAFDNVKVVNPGVYPWGDKYYKCKGVANSTATHGTNPIPPCFDHHTN